MKNDPSTHRNTIPAAGWTILALWFAGALFAVAAGAFEQGPTEAPLPLMAAVAFPVLVFALAYWGSARFQEFALGLDLRLLTALQGWRVIGGVFIVLYFYGMLPGFFAWPAGAGDVAVGLAAPFVVLAMVTGAPGWRRSVLALNVAGLVDFAVAVVTGLLTSPTSFGILTSDIDTSIVMTIPLGLIPAFGVPFFIIMHLISLIQLRRAGATERAAGHVTAQEQEQSQAA